MRTRKISPSFSSGSPLLEERALIPEGTIISDLLEGLRIERTFYSTLDRTGMPLEGHCSADELIGFFFTDGEALFSFHDAEPIKARRRDYLLIGRYTRYLVEPASESGPCSIGRVTFKFDSTIARLLFRLLPNILFIREFSDEEMRWQLMAEHLINHHPPSIRMSSSAINHRLVEAVLVSLIQTWLYQNGSLGYQFDNPEVARIFPSLRAMHKTSGKAWSVKALADISGMSKTSFATKFLDVTGETPARYLTTLRLEKAKELLRIRHLLLSEVAQHAGYGTDSAFIRAFQREFGLTPGQFRESEGSATPRDPALSNQSKLQNN